MEGWKWLHCHYPVTVVTVKWSGWWNRSFVAYFAINRRTKFIFPFLTLYILACYRKCWRRFRRHTNVVTTVIQLHKQVWGKRKFWLIIGTYVNHGCLTLLFIDFLTKMSYFTSQEGGNPVQIIKCWIINVSTHSKT